ncbi:PAS domain-containing sensor histidine kinase [Roseicella aquatilis]|nr:PAS domain-containing protein [Roseicella aquatilis]
MTRLTPPPMPAMDPAAMPACLRHGGQAGALLRMLDWTDSPLGAPATWPPPLRTTVGLVLEARFPMFVAWGPELRLLYNDAYAELLGDKHPGALGGRFQEVWAEIWPALRPLVEATLAGEAVYQENLPLTLHRRGFDEQAWFTFSYSPLRDEAGAVAGLFCTCSETTGQVLASRRVEEERTRQRRLLQQMPGFAAYLARPEHRFEYVNDAYVALVGRREFLGRTVREVFPELAGQGFYELLDRVYIRGERYVARAVPVRLGDDAVERRIDLLYEPVFDETGQVAGIFAGGYDVTEQARAEAALRTAAERVQLALDAGAIIGTWVWDLPADAFTVDERFAFFFGLDPALGQSGLRLEQVIASVHPDDLPGLRAAIAAVLARGGAYSHEYRVRGRDGTWRWIEANGRVDLAADGTPLRFPGVLLDTEGRRALEAERDRAAALLRSFIEAVPGVVYAKDHEGRMLLANQGTAALIGQPAEAFLGRTDAEFLADPAQAEAIMATDRRIMDNGLTERVEETVSLPDGTPAVWLSTKAPFRDAAGRVVGLIGTSIDITDRKRAEAALHEALEVKELLLAEMNHRVKNSLQLVSSLLTLQAARAQAEETRAALDEARGRISVVARLHQRLYRSGLYDAVDLVTLLRDLCADTATALGGDGRIGLVFRPDGVEAGLPLPIDRAVPVALIVSELLTNALKYAYPEEAPGGLVRVSLRRAPDDSGQGGLLVTVEDDGAGLPEGFDPAASRGLGMRVVTTLARQLRASFSVGPGADGRGSAFWFWLPDREVSAP